MSEMFWKLPDLTIRSPMAIIKEQGALLTDATNGVLVGTTLWDLTGNRTTIYLKIDIPNAKEYRFNVISYSFDIVPYPGNLGINIYSRTRIDRINSEQELSSALKNCLGSDEMQLILSSLYSQAMAQEVAPQRKALSSLGCLSDACV